MPDDEFSDRLREQVLKAYGFDSMEEVDEAFDPDGSYRAARAELDAEEAAYRAALPGRMQEAVTRATEHMRATGELPPGFKFVVVEGS